MRKARVFLNGVEAGIFSEVTQGAEYIFEYHEGYDGPGVSRTMLPSRKRHTYTKFPPFFEGVLPEGIQLEGLLNLNKIDRNDLFSQLMAVGNDLVGAVTVQEIME